MVSRRSDFIIYSVEAEYIDNVVAQYGPYNNTSTLFPRSNQAERDCRGAEPEIAAFEKHLPADVHIISCHSLHGPTVDTKGQPLVRQCAINPLYFWFRPSKFDVPPSHSFTKVMMKHRASQEKFDLTIRVLSCLESDFVFLSYKEHDRITADTQAVTHAAFLRSGHHESKRQDPDQSVRQVGRGSVFAHDHRERGGASAEGENCRGVCLRQGKRPPRVYSPLRQSAGRVLALQRAEGSIQAQLAPVVAGDGEWTAGTSSDSTPTNTWSAKPHSSDYG
ncbi:hypothetical protein BC936DRAFT_146228, partial [Jimgerdemannia flammicorona]